jgi:hypothetical protein
MEQRPLRLGDILDDYCPRERRVTNHAIVAMIEDDVKQTRCTTCDAEHVYKGGKAPRRKKSDSTGALYKEVLAGISDQESPAPPEHVPAQEDATTLGAAPAEPDAEPVSSVPVEAELEDEGEQPVIDEGPVHRPLIRAQLPRIEGLKIERQAPEFTIRQHSGRGGSSRGSNVHTSGRNTNSMGGGGANGGSRFGRGPHRGGGRGPNQGFGRGPGGGDQQRQGGPRKRSR